MKSLRCLYRVGPGPSSSHTLAPYCAAIRFKSFLLSPLSSIRVTLYGSLALTGKGHRSDNAISNGLYPRDREVIFDVLSPVNHPNTVKFEEILDKKVLQSKIYLSLGGGELFSPDDERVSEKEIYPFNSLKSIKREIREKGLSSVKEFCQRYEDEHIDEYLDLILKEMFASIDRGLSREGTIIANGNPRLRIVEVAGKLYEKASKMKEEEGRKEMLLTAYAYAVGEENACGENVVTAPTCGSAGVLPAVLYYLHHNQGVPLSTLRDSLYAAGVIGNLVKQNASISGAVGGCQAEIGTASSMAAAAYCSAMGLSLHEVEYASEVAMEHFLGLSCDPVDGYVMIPCIERNGIGAIRAYTSYLYAANIACIRENKVSFDEVVEAMKVTGDSLEVAYKETSLGGLAEILRKEQND